MSTQTVYSFRFLAYCASSGRTPEQQLDHDRMMYPGGCMSGYTLWISGLWLEYHRRNPLTKRHSQTDEDHRAFDLMLAAMLGGH